MFLACQTADLKFNGTLGWLSLQDGILLNTDTLRIFVKCNEDSEIIQSGIGNPIRYAINEIVNLKISTDLNLGVHRK